jgi:hypothetical protein
MEFKLWQFAIYLSKKEGTLWRSPLLIYISIVAVVLLAA